MPITVDQYAQLISDAQHIAMRDISMTGEFSNPYHPINERIQYRAYEAVRKHYFDDQLDFVYQQLGEQVNESTPPAK